MAKVDHTGGFEKDSAESLDTNLQAYWKLDEVGVDSKGTNNLTDNATVTSNPGKKALPGSSLRPIASF